jgi:hypothetical protein
MLFLHFIAHSAALLQASRSLTHGVLVGVLIGHFFYSNSIVHLFCKVLIIDYDRYGYC